MVMQYSIGTSKLFKSGNSYGFRVTKHDKELLSANAGDVFDKEISPDGQTITFKKRKKVSPETLALIDKLFDENRELMERLKDE
jgi:antitoxin component of MazEF toxin-antitoxin module